MGRRSFAVSSVVIVFGTIVAACVGDDPGPSTSSSSSSGSTGDGGSSGGTGAVACTAASPCATGTCVDGFCCDAPCTGVCEACNVPGSEGKCTAAKGKPAHGKCDGDADGVCAGSCDGTNRASCTYPEVECGAPSCAGGTATVPPHCKAGVCPAATTQPCSLGCFESGCLGVQQIAADASHVCALLTDGTVRCWGDNSFGQCGFIGGAEVKTPTEVTGLTGIVSIAAASGATCAVGKDGSVKCWGANGSGQLGLGGATDTNAHAPATIPTISGATFVGGSSGGHFCAIVANGALKCWGSNYGGQLGAGKTSPSETTPVSVCAPGATNPVGCPIATGAKFVTGGDNYTCAILAGDKVACWGTNGQGATGQAGTGNVLFATFVSGNLTATYLAAGNQTTCAVTGGGAKCFGYGARVGNCDTTNANFSDPQDVGANTDCTQKLTGVTGVSTADESVCAVASGAVKCWGTGTGGQFGDGSSNGTRNYAGSNAIATGAVYVASGGGLNYAIVQNGVERDVRCWGGESLSQCGTGSASGERLTPVAPKWK